MRTWMALVCALCLTPAWGERAARTEQGRQAQATTPTAATPTAATPVQLTLEEKADLWRLSIEDYQRYLALMQGPRGIWSPDADPLSVLGAAAESEAERVRYARLFVDLEQARLVGEQAFRDTLRQVVKARGADDLYDPAQVARLLREATAKRQAGGLREGDHLLFFTQLDCARCEAAFLRALERFKSTRRAQLDVYVRGADSDLAINQWATTNQLPKDLFGGRLTLNHERGYLNELLGVDALTRPLPLMMVERNHQLMVLEDRP